MGKGKKYHWEKTIIHNGWNPEESWKMIARMEKA